MKRFTLLLGVFVCAVILATSHLSVAHDGEGEVTICHVTQNFERPNGIVFYVGMIIEVDHHAVPGHVNHGDVTVEDFPGVVTPNGMCCSFSVLPGGEIVPGQVD